MTIIIDEANLAFNIDANWVSNRDVGIEKAKSALELFAKLTKQEKKV